MEVLETQLTTARHKFNGEAWGMDLFPTYATEKRKGKKSAVVGGDPWYGFPDTKSERVCHEHQKVKCDTCKRRGKSVAWCCEAHHKEDDGLAVKFCAQHRLTQCATCNTIAECCRTNGHHRCLDHGMPTCAHCSRLADLRSRRPKLCCRKGHHRAAVARGEESTTKKRKAEPEGPAPAPRQAKRENVVLVLPEAAEGEREPATSTPTSAAKVEKTHQRQRSEEAAIGLRGGAGTEKAQRTRRCATTIAQAPRRSRNRRATDEPGRAIDEEEEAKHQTRA
ncbi:hypothetical protein DIPPA_10124 [Diplonema papillatum]|nr:hypothetical protein DIPPA_10124 [Diplonema papillatum]